MQDFWRHEDFPVTFQLGMVAKDGVLLASDKKGTKISTPNQRNKGARKSFLTEKILKGHGLLYCWTGDDLTMSVAQNIAGFLCKEPRTQGADLITAYAQSAMYKEADAFRRDLKSVYGDILIGRRVSLDNFELWQISLDFPSSGKTQRILNKETQGDNANTAHFFLERYFPELPTRIDALLHLAAHTVLMAGATASTYIGGLEIAMCTNSELRTLTNKELQPLIRLSRSLDSKTGSLFSRPKSSN